MRAKVVIEVDPMWFGTKLLVHYSSAVPQKNSLPVNSILCWINNNDDNENNKNNKMYILNKKNKLVELYSNFFHTVPNLKTHTNVKPIFL